MFLWEATLETALACLERPLAAIQHESRDIDWVSILPSFMSGCTSWSRISRSRNRKTNRIKFSEATLKAALARLSVAGDCASG